MDNLKVHEALAVTVYAVLLFTYFLGTFGYSCYNPSKDFPVGDLLTATTTLLVSALAYSLFTKRQRRTDTILNSVHETMNHVYSVMIAAYEEAEPALVNPQLLNGHRRSMITNMVLRASNEFYAFVDSRQHVTILDKNVDVIELCVALDLFRSAISSFEPQHATWKENVQSSYNNYVQTHFAVLRDIDSSV